MALSSETQFEVRGVTGSDTNGGGYVAGSTGTDFSLQAAAQIAVVDAVANGTTTITSATAAFAATHVGNVMYLQGGTGSLAETRRYVVSRTNATTIVVDAAVATGTGITLNLGGALATIAKAFAFMIQGNRTWIKADGTYTLAATVTSAWANVGNNTPWVSGYTNVRGDAGRAFITLNGSSLSAFACPSVNGAGYNIENFDINCASQTTSAGINFGANSFSGFFKNVKVSNFTNIGIGSGTNNAVAIMECETTGGSGSNAGFYLKGSSFVTLQRCYSHDNACAGIIVGTFGVSASIIHCIITKNTGSTSDGVLSDFTNGLLIAVNNTIHGNGRDGIRLSNNSIFIGMIYSNMLTGNGVSAAGYGLNHSGGTAQPATPLVDGNFYWGNTTGTLNNFSGTTGLWNVPSYVYSKNITGTGNPYVDSTNNNFSLSNTLAGAIARSSGLPGTIPGAIGQGYVDFGCLQTKNSDTNTSWPSIPGPTPFPKTLW